MYMRTFGSRKRTQSWIRTTCVKRQSHISSAANKRLYMSNTQLSRLAPLIDLLMALAAIARATSLLCDVARRSLASFMQSPGRDGRRDGGNERAYKIAQSASFDLQSMRTTVRRLGVTS